MRFQPLSLLFLQDTTPPRFQIKNDYSDVVLYFVGKGLNEKPEIEIDVKRKQETLSADGRLNRLRRTVKLINWPQSLCE
jgi:hypothetical protein